MDKSLFSIAFTLFLLMDPIGNVPFYLSFLKGINPRRQRAIIIREMLIALGIIILFTYLGDGLMRFLDVSMETIQISGGIILFIICLKMIFPSEKDHNETIPHQEEPFLVPLAVPLVAGPSVLAAVMIYSKQLESDLIMIGAVFLAWAASLVILVSSSLLKKVLGWRGITAMERLMGLVLTLIAVQMFLSGVHAFVKNS